MYLLAVVFGQIEWLTPEVLAPFGIGGVIVAAFIRYGLVTRSQAEVDAGWRSVLTAARERAEEEHKARTAADARNQILLERIEQLEKKNIADREMDKITIGAHTGEIIRLKSIIRGLGGEP